MGKDGNIGADASVRPLRIDPSYATYAEDKLVFDLLAEMAKDLIMNLPSDPLAHMIDFLKQPQVPRVFVHGPLGSGRRLLCDHLASKANVIHLGLDEIVAAAIEVESDYGNAAAPFVKAGDTIPNRILVPLVLDRLNEGDCKRNGFVLRDFPNNRAQAVAMQMHGLLPTHVFVFEGTTEALAKQYLHGTLVHKKTKRTYHTTLFPPPSAIIADACEPLTPPSTHVVCDALETYRLNLSAYCTTYATAVSKLNADQPVEDTFREAWTRLCTMRQSDAPFIPRLVISGANGSGAVEQANNIAKKYGAVAVHMGYVLQKAIDAGNAVSRSISTSLKNSTPILDTTLETLVVKELSSVQCQTNGWVLTGYPNTASQARSLCTRGYTPNRSFFLQVEKDVALSRLEGRRIDPVSGKSYHLKFNPPPSDVVAERLTQHPIDDSEAIERALDDYDTTWEELTESFSTHVCIDANFDADAVRGFIDSHLVRPHLPHPVC